MKIHFTRPIRENRRWRRPGASKPQMLSVSASIEGELGVEDRPRDDQAVNRLATMPTFSVTAKP